MNEGEGTEVEEWRRKDRGGGRKDFSDVVAKCGICNNVLRRSLH